MPTIDNKRIVDELVALNGRSPGDDPVVRIVQYTNHWDGTRWGLEYKGELGRYSESDYVIAPIVYWQR